MAAARWRWRFPVAAGLLLIGLAPAFSQLDYGFMPKGGKALLLDVLGTAANEQELRDIVAARRNEAEWRDAMAARTKSLSEREQRTLVAYLAANMPVSSAAATAAKAGKRDDLVAGLPRDGRDLAWNECQFCHSLFTGYLTQDRDIQAWMNMFQSPFHRELKLTAQERAEFSRYSAINMPMKIEDVPAELRF